MSNINFEDSALGKIINSPEGTTEKLKFGKLEILEELGRGAAGVVYKVLETNLSRIVAIKTMEKCFLPENEAIRFKDEGKIIARLDHPNIIKVKKLEETDEAYLLYMDYIEGVTLDKFWMEKKLSWMQIATIIKQIVSAIEHAHKKGIVHRDLKPSNIMIKDQHKCYVMDFGLAKILGSKNNLTSMGTIMGTPTYMSPEQAQGKVEVDHRTDLYSIGAILYEALCEQTCFSAKTSLALIMKIVKEEPIPPKEIVSSVPEKLEKICMKALSKDQNRRYQNASEMIEDLEEYILEEKEYHTPVKMESKVENMMRSSQVIIPSKKRRRSKRHPRVHTTRRHSSFKTSTNGEEIDKFSQSQLGSGGHNKKKSTTIRRTRSKKSKDAIGWSHILSLIIVILLVAIFVFKSLE